MAGNHEGAIKARNKNLERDPDFFKRIGAIGGRATVSKGFGKNPELARIAGAKGGKKSKRSKATKVADKTPWWRKERSVK